MEVLHVRALKTIPAPVADALLAKGCRSASDVLSRPNDVYEVLRQLHDDDSERKAEAILSGCRREAEGAWNSADSALELLQRAQTHAPVVLPCQGLNTLLGTALRPGSGRVLELCGLPGTGKTQLCMQICASAQIAVAPGVGSADVHRYAEAVYVDAEGSFAARRYAQVCRAVLQSRWQQRGPDGNSEAAELENVLRGMHVCRTYDAAELYATIKQLGRFMRARRRVRAFIIDSLAFCFRHEFADNLPQRARILSEIAGMLRRYSSELGMVVVVTNHMTTKFDRSNEGGWLCPALGETWAHQPGTQVRLERCTGPEATAALPLAPSLTGGPAVQAAWPPARHQLVVPAGGSGGCSAGPLVAAGVGGGPLTLASASGHGPVGMAKLTKSMEQAVGKSCHYRIVEDGIRDM